MKQVYGTAPMCEHIKEALRDKNKAQSIMSQILTQSNLPVKVINIDGIKYTNQKPLV